MKNDCIIRLETSRDHTEVEYLVRESFWNVYRPGCLEHYVLHCLREDPAFVPELDFVMEKDGVIIGQNIFMRASIAADDGRSIPILTMGPICIAPELKRQGYGKVLLDYSLEQAAKLGAGAVCFEGNIDFYGKSGFTHASRFSLVHEISGRRCVLAGDAVQIPRNEFIAQEEGRIFPFRQTMIADTKMGSIGESALAVEVDIAFKAHSPCAQLRGLLQGVVQKKLSVPLPL